MPGRGEPVQITAEPATNSLLVVANENELAELKKLIATIDVAPEAERELKARVITLKNADAEAVSRTLNEIFVRSAARPQGTQGPPISIAALTGSRAVLVKCREEDFARIEEVVKRLDSDEAKAGEEVRVVPILYGDATEMQTAVQEYLRKPGQAGGRGANLVGDVRVSVLTQGNALVISGEKAEVEQLEATIRGMDESGIQGSVPQLIPLKHANVGQILPVVQEMFEGQSAGQRRGQMPPVIVGNEAINALVVRSGPTDYMAIKSVVDQLDTEEVKQQQPFRILQVAAGVNLNAVAEQVEQAVNDSARALPASSGRGRQTPQVTITPNMQTRTLLVAGTPTLFDQVEQIVRTYEKMAPTGDTTTAIIRQPESVTVEEIQMLIQLLTEQEASSGSRTGRASRPASRPAAPRQPVGRPGSPR
jgi:type II secretory pathway component GspD/PulD (secretin)